MTNDLNLDSFSLHCSQILFALALKGNRGECVGEACPQLSWLSFVLLQARRHRALAEQQCGRQQLAACASFLLPVTEEDKED